MAYMLSRVKITNAFQALAQQSELVTATQVLLELISVRDGAFCMPEFDSKSVRQFIFVLTNLY